MEPFAMVFMIVSMGAVTALAGYTLSRTMRAPGPGDDDSRSED